MTQSFLPLEDIGFDLYKELEFIKVLIYSRFDSSSYDFISDTTFAQIGVLKNPIAAGAGSTAVLNTSEYSSTKSIKFTGNTTQSLAIGAEIKQNITGIGTAKGYVASYDISTGDSNTSRQKSLFEPRLLRCDR